MKIKDLRKKNNHTQLELADLLGIPRTTYATYEQESAFPTDILEKIAAKYSVSFEKLKEDNAEQQQNLNDESLKYENFNEILQRSHALVVETKDELIKVLKTQITETKATDKLLTELIMSANAAEQKHQAVLTRTLAVQEVLLEYFGKLNNIAYQDIDAIVRIKVDEFQKAVPKK